MASYLTQCIKSGGHGPGIVRVVVARVAVGVDKAEIVRVARIDGPAPDIGRRRKRSAALPLGTFSEIHPNNDPSGIPLSIAVHDVPQKGFFLVDQVPQFLGHAVQPLHGLLGRYALSLAVRKGALRVLA